MEGNILPDPADGEPIDLLASVHAKLDAILANQGKPPQRYFTVADTASYCGLSQASVRQAISSGHLLAHRPPGCEGRVLLDKQQVDAWMASGRGRRPRAGRGRRRSG